MEKELRLQKSPNMSGLLELLDYSEQETVNLFYEKVMLEGDEIFRKDKPFVDRLLHLNIDKVIPILIELLNTLETGKHEPCTIFGTILKLGKQDIKVKYYIREAIEKKSAPKYYLDELSIKLKKP